MAGEKDTPDETEEVARDEEVTETGESPQAEAAAEAITAEQALEEEKAKAERYLANWRRAEADFDNYKKRVEQERSENAKFAHISLVLSLLPIIDDFDRAFGTLMPSLAGLTWIDGIRLIGRKLQANLEARGLTEIKCLGEQFDPLYHEAVMQVEGEEGKVVAELQKGYKLYDRVIRPALVVVGKAPEKIPEEPKEEEARESLDKAGEEVEKAAEEEGGGTAD
ncbi:MAG: nucleotide exchange factor GrpE [Chloroflexi bacterium]|nr:nucleotide exchange factor GrpE [Chloroflexota bacterium]